METNKEQEIYTCKACKKQFCRVCEQEKNNKTITDVVGKACVDIFKYVVTAVIITTFLGGFEQRWLIYVVGFIIAFLALGTGFYFMNKKKK